MFALTCQSHSLLFSSFPGFDFVVFFFYVMDLFKNWFRLNSSGYRSSRTKKEALLRMRPICEANCTLFDLFYAVTIPTRGRVDVRALRRSSIRFRLLSRNKFRKSRFWQRNLPVVSTTALVCVISQKKSSKSAMNFSVNQLISRCKWRACLTGSFVDSLWMRSFASEAVDFHESHVCQVSWLAR